MIHEDEIAELENYNSLKENEDSLSAIKACTKYMYTNLIQHSFNRSTKKKLYMRQSQQLLVEQHFAINHKEKELLKS